MTHIHYNPTHNQRYLYPVFPFPFVLSPDPVSIPLSVALLLPTEKCYTTFQNQQFGKKAHFCFT